MKQSRHTHIQIIKTVNMDLEIPKTYIYVKIFNNHKTVWKKNKTNSKKEFILKKTLINMIIIPEKLVQTLFK